LGIEMPDNEELWKAFSSITESAEFDSQATRRTPRHDRKQPRDKRWIRFGILTLHPAIRGPEIMKDRNSFEI
jgi:hypothetical protein